MSITQYQSQVNSLDKEIASLEKKKSDTADMTAEEIAAELKTLFEQDKTEENDNGQA